MYARAHTLRADLFWRARADVAERNLHGRVVHADAEEDAVRSLRRAEGLPLFLRWGAAHPRQFCLARIVRAGPRKFYSAKLVRAGAGAEKTRAFLFAPRTGRSAAGQALFFLPEEVRRKRAQAAPAVFVLAFCLCPYVSF